jgi:hypothetical protein
VIQPFNTSFIAWLEAPPDSPSAGRFALLIRLTGVSVANAIHLAAFKTAIFTDLVGHGIWDAVLDAAV